MMGLLAEGLSAHANGLEHLRSCYGRPSRLPCGNLSFVHCPGLGINRRRAVVKLLYDFRSHTWAAIPVCLLTYWNLRPQND